jgi:DNA-directed RNA polymerase III subunit RPC1
VVLDMEAIAALQLAIDAHTVKWSILDTPKMKLKPDAIRAVSIDTLLVVPPDASRQGLLFGLEQLMAALPKVGAGTCVVLRGAAKCMQNVQPASCRRCSELT